MSNHAKRVDLNQPEVVSAFRKLGWTVSVMSRVGEGVPDLYVSKRGKGFWIEVKSMKGKLTESEQEFFDLHPGCCSIIRSAEEVSVFDSLQQALVL